MNAFVAAGDVPRHVFCLFAMSGVLIVQLGFG